MTNHRRRGYLGYKPRAWQAAALDKWSADLRGVVRVVTGGGKTTFALFCMHEFWQRHPDGRIVILVPTLTLLDQWYVALREDLGVPGQQIACFSSQEKRQRARTVNLFVINSARALVRRITTGRPRFLVVDECHRAGSPQNAKALQGEFEAALGLSATPTRDYDRGFEEHVAPVLGTIIFDYDYTEAHDDTVIASFDLVNVRVDFLPHEKREYDRLTRRLGQLFTSLQTAKDDAGLQVRLKSTLQVRAAVSAKAAMRVPVAAKLVEQHRGVRTVVFCERVDVADTLSEVLSVREHNVCVYHSKIAPEVRRDNLRLFRRGVFDVLISCRALDEGMNVPEAAIAVIASSTASRRQRVQRLGRVLRTAADKESAVIYTLFVTKQEMARLRDEARELSEITRVTWVAAARVSRG